MGFWMMPFAMKKRKHKMLTNHFIRSASNDLPMRCAYAPMVAGGHKNGCLPSVMGPHVTIKSNVN